MLLIMQGKQIDFFLAKEDGKMHIFNFKNLFFGSQTIQLCLI